MENNNEVSLNCDTKFLLCRIPLLSFRFDLGRLEMASYRYYFLVWFCDCLIHWFVSRYYAVKSSQNPSFIFNQSHVYYTSGRRRRPKSHNFKGLKITLRLSPKVIGLISELYRACCTRASMIDRRSSLSVEYPEGTM